MQQLAFNAIDGLAVPVTHTFKNLGANLTFAKDGSIEGIAYWKDFDASNDVGRKILVHKFKAPPSNSASGFIRQSLVLKVPKVNTVGISDSGITPAVTTAYFNQYKHEQLVSVRAPATDLVAEFTLYRNILGATGFGSSGAGIGTGVFTLNESFT